MCPTLCQDGLEAVMEAFSHKQILLSKNHLLVNGPSTLATQLVPSESAEGNTKTEHLIPRQGSAQKKRAGREDGNELEGAPAYHI